jgi:hypothetical protein
MSGTMSGYKVAGYHYHGKPDLGSIGELISWHDWRFGRTDGVFSGTTRVLTLNDLSPNGFLLEGSPVSSSQTRPMVLPDGLGMDDTIASKNAANFRKLGSNSKYEILHKGSPFLIMVVVKPIVISSNLNIFATSLSGVKAGFRLRFAASSSLIGCSWFNDAGTGISSNQTSVNSITAGSFLFICAQYYGSGTGSNNFKIWINNTQYTFTVNPTFGTGPCDGLYSWQGAGGAAGSAYEFSQKLAVSYNLTGKSTAQIDAFRALAISTLKQDSEYSGLTTP